MATSQGAAGLEVEAGEQLLIANTALEFANSVKSIAEDSELRSRLIAGGRQALASRHDPQVIAQRLTRLYRAVSR